MERYIEEELVLEKIKEVIYELYPIRSPRMTFDKSGYYKNLELRIYFCFYKDNDGEIKTQVYFCKDNKGIDKYYLVNGKISLDTVGNLMILLLSEFPYVNSVQTRLNGFDIDCVLGLEHFLEEGISCNKVSIVFDTNPRLHRDFSQLFQDYLNYIISNFMEYMGRAPQIREAYKKYRASMKKKIVNSFSLEDLQQFIGLLSEEELRDLLIGMNTDKFFELCDKCGENINKSKSLKLVKSIPTKIIDG